jgi:hypothetical protein
MARSKLMGLFQAVLGITTWSTYAYTRNRRYQAFGWDLRLHPRWDKREDNKGQS